MCPNLIKRVYSSIDRKGFLNFLSDEAYLKLKYRMLMNEKLNFNSPETFTQKLQWLKINNKNPLHQMLVDKFEVKQYVADKIGDEYIIPTLGVWDSFDEIDFNALPNQFVLKCTHDSGGLVICKDKSKLDIKQAKKIINKSLKKNYFFLGREWPYKDLKPRIIAEKYIEDSNGALVDYKFFCFHGVADSVMVCMDRHLNNTKFYFFDKQWKLKRYNYMGVQAPENFTVPMPENMTKMFEIAETLSKDLTFVRMDLYDIDGQIYFGEFTFYPTSGYNENLLPDANEYFGDLINIELLS